MRQGADFPDKGEASTAWSGCWIVLSLLLVFVIGTGLTLKETPALTYDEGWTLMVAKNWTEGRGYTQSLLDKPVPAKMLNIGFPAVAPMALSLLTLGVGIWQARLPSLLFTVASLGMLCVLTIWLFDRVIARTALLALFFASMGFHPFFWGRLAIGEPAGVCYLLAAFVLFLAGESRSVAFLMLSGGLLALACVTKVQFVPFVSIGLIVPLALLAYRKSSAQACTLIYWLGSFSLSCALFFLVQRLLVGDERLTERGLYTSTAFVPNIDVRLSALYSVVTHGLPTVVALVVACRSFSSNLTTRKEIARTALLAFSLSWVVWYVCSSVGWARYMYPCIMVGSPFVGKLLHSLVAHTRLAFADRRWRTGLLLASVTAVPLVWSGALTLVGLHDTIKSRDDSLVEVARFFEHLPKGQVIESFDMQVFFLLQTRQYHYPPDRVQLLLNRRSFLGEQVSIDYDPLMADPDYLVVGPAGRWLKVYDDIRYDPRHFIPVGRAGSYEVYRRARPAK
ncbi:MAG: ArnT family glycosyltransferase [Acidobacteriota bacterium]